MYANPTVLTLESRSAFAKLLKEAALYETQPEQDLSEYCFNKLDKLRSLKLKIPEEYLVDAVIGGVTDESIARSARASRFQTSNEIYAYLSTLGKMPSSKTPSQPEVAGNKRRLHRPYLPTTSHSQERLERTQTQMQCFNCKGPHRVRDCKKPKLECFNCSRLGHIAKSCPDKKKEQTKDSRS